MAAKTANVLARVEPDVKENAEAIMSQLGVPVSVVINMLYKQIIIKRGIPFSLFVSDAPKAFNEMNSIEFDEIMHKGMEDAVSNSSRPVAEVFSDLRKKI
jgi:addiction module RelB/DinJ family antitoxin